MLELRVKLPKAAELYAYNRGSDGRMYVLAHWPGSWQNWVTWQVDPTKDNACVSGHYFSNRKDADEDFHNRIS